MLNIKDATVDDIATIRDLAQKTWPGTYVPIIGEQQVAYMLDLFYSPRKLTEQMQEQGHRFIVAYDGDTAIGFASWSEVEPGIFKLHKLYVLPAVQGSGAGTTLLKKVQHELTTASASKLRLNVNRYNATAISFYRKMGFIILKDEDIDIGSNYFMNDHIFEIDIK